ncbi:uncharacterized protein BDR25DRAFT_352476 [Lindgomyces ingoldianus]|uniref:Uncharacterized protein n=1 Tax=Lindgomyces ingoldianus TaxID=673940 RepID=A0ACB6R591_9PLEO|nr:uncharacterized protein BDR25DRAFT_352476 [Lindgomyces ingoldianus]KAF2474008.1 hypothetical protein BDR25DRAFT_352476 [Lindgomyces ingoldianus]
MPGVGGTNYQGGCAVPFSPSEQYMKRYCYFFYRLLLPALLHGNFWLWIRPHCRLKVDDRHGEETIKRFTTESARSKNHLVIGMYHRRSWIDSGILGLCIPSPEVQQPESGLIWIKELEGKFALSSRILSCHFSSLWRSYAQDPLPTCYLNGGKKVKKATPPRLERAQAHVVRANNGTNVSIYRIHIHAGNQHTMSAPHCQTSAACRQKVEMRVSTAVFQRRLPPSPRRLQQAGTVARIEKADVAAKQLWLLPIVGVLLPANVPSTAALHILIPSASTIVDEPARLIKDKPYLGETDSTITKSHMASSGTLGDRTTSDRAMLRIVSKEDTRAKQSYQVSVEVCKISRVRTCQSSVRLGHG